MRPTSDKIFIEPIDKKVTSLIIPPKYAYRAKEFFSGIVIAKGKKVTQDIQVGDEVAYAKDFGCQVEHDGKKFTVIKPGHILAIV